MYSSACHLISDGAYASLSIHNIWLQQGSIRGYTIQAADVIRKTVTDVWADDEARKIKRKFHITAF